MEKSKALIKAIEISVPTLLFVFCVLILKGVSLN